MSQTGKCLGNWKDSSSLPASFCLLGAISLHQRVKRIPWPKILAARAQVAWDAFALQSQKLKSVSCVPVHYCQLIRLSQPTIRFTQLLQLWHPRGPRQISTTIWIQLFFDISFPCLSSFLSALYVFQFAHALTLAYCDLART